jgi:hypothetical protein
MVNGQKFPIVAGVEAVVEGIPIGEEVVFNVEGGLGAAGAAAAAEEEEEELEEEDDDDKTSTSTTTTSSTTSSSATSIPSSYLIFPKDGSNSNSNAGFEQKLEKLSAPNSISAIPQVNGVAFWTAELTTHNAMIIQNDPFVSLLQILTT